MHTISCATAHHATCHCTCNHTLHGYLSGVLSDEQHRRVRQPLLEVAESHPDWDESIHAEGALRELDHLLGQASEQLKSGALGRDALKGLLDTVGAGGSGPAS